MTAAAAGDAVFRSIKESNSVSDEQLSIKTNPGKNLLEFNVWKRCFGFRAKYRSRRVDSQASLHFLYGKNLERAMQILDQGRVKLIVGEPSNRAVFQVAGETKNSDQYICFPEHHCTCYSFFYDTVNKGEQLCCKHQLAARMADAHKLYKEEKISDEQLALLLLQH